MDKNNLGIIKDMAKLFSATILSGLFFTGCVDMDLTPKNQPSEGEVWADATMAEQTDTGLYNGLNHLYNDNYNMWFDCFSAVMDRDANWRNFGMLFGNQTTSGDGPSWIWHDNYKFIIRCNDVIANMPDVVGLPEAKKARLIAEAKFLRSYWYYELNLLFGGVPYYTEPIKNIEEAKGSRLSMTDLWNELIKDLTDCINEPNLPDKYNSGDNDYGHITKGAAYALRGKIYLWLENWGAAEADFKKVGDCGDRKFTCGAIAYKMLFKEVNEQCDEMIFSVQCIEEDGYWNSKNRGFGNRCTYGSMWNNYLVNPDFVDTYECADGSKFDWSKIIPEYYKLTVNERRVFFLRDNLTESEIANAKEQGANMDYYLPSGNEARIRKAYEQRDPRLEMSVITPYATYLGGDGGADNYFTNRYPFRSQWIETQNADGTITREASDLRTDTQAMFYYLNRKFVTEGVGEACGKEVCHTASFFIGEAGIFMVGGGVGDIDVFVGHVQVAAENHRLFGGQFCHVFFHSFFPGHAVGKACQSPLAVGGIAAEKVVASEVGGNEPSFLVVFFYTQTVGDGEGLFFCEDGGTAVAFLYGAVPVLVISRQVQLDLVGLQFGFLQAEAVCIQGIESVHKAFFYAGPKSVYVPGNIFQCFHGSLLI